MAAAAESEVAVQMAQACLAACPLDALASRGHAAALRVLLAHADRREVAMRLQGVNCKGHTPLESALLGSHAEAARALLEYGYPHSLTGCLRDAMRKVCDCHLEGMALLLLQWGVDWSGLTDVQREWLAQRAASAYRTTKEELVRVTRCVVCMATERQAVFEPCGHVACCMPCATRCDVCPLCKAAINEQMRVYL